MQRPPLLLRASDLAFRSLFSSIFLVAGLGHFVQRDRMVERLLAAPLGHLAQAVAPAPLLITLTGIVLVVAGLGLLLGLQARLCALALAAVLVPITVTVHVGDPAHVGPLFKNVALLGGLLHFAARGAGAFSLEARFRSAAPGTRPAAADAGRGAVAGACPGAASGRR